jgi:hypothetical protein
MSLEHEQYGRGYAQCQRCGVQRTDSELEVKYPEALQVCRDEKLCDKLRLERERQNGKR